jgi:hypothetical protein
MRDGSSVGQEPLQRHAVRRLRCFHGAVRGLHSCQQAERPDDNDDISDGMAAKTQCSILQPNVGPGNNFSSDQNPQLTKDGWLGNQAHSGKESEARQAANTLLEGISKTSTAVPCWRSRVINDTFPSPFPFRAGLHTTGPLHVMLRRNTVPSHVVENGSSPRDSSIGPNSNSEYIFAPALLVLLQIVTLAHKTRNIIPLECIS